MNDRSQATRVLSLAIMVSLSFLAASGTVFAAGTATRDGVVQFEWESPQNRECGQACLYKKTNENLSTEALYAVKKVQALENASPTEQLENLRGFCLPNEHGSACFERYRDFVLLRLRRIRGHIGANSAAAGSLDSENANVVVAKGASTVFNPVSRTYVESQDLPQAPRIPTFDELHAQRMREVERRPDLGREEYTWNGIVPHEPEESDYVIYCEVPRRSVAGGASVPRNCAAARDHGLPSGQRILIADTSCGRPICIDQQAFAAAQAGFTERSEHFRTTSPYSGLAGAPAEFEREPELDVRSEGQISIQAYNDARGGIIERANEVILGRAPGVPAPGAGSVLGAATQGAQPHYTGHETVARAPGRGRGRADSDVFVSFTSNDLGLVIQNLDPDTSGTAPAGALAAGSSAGPSAPSSSATPTRVPSASRSTSASPTAPLPGPSAVAPSEPYGSAPVDLSELPTQVLP